MVQDEQGMTLLEVLLSMVILSIVLLTMVNFFPQMGRMNTYNSEKMEAVNIARGELALWKESGSLGAPPSNYSKYTGTEPDTYDYYTSTVDEYNVQVKIHKVSKLSETGSSSRTKAHQILLQVVEDQKIVSETYGYLMVNE
ncbi:type II secretion system protein [Rossellomorea sp. AcN35-11]|nr:type II secretion system GspH family protein [Rossellomorea aquimaris]WJV30902.1 type II secretion system protein [Rossellomorea sp. AcN35-11]